MPDLKLEGEDRSRRYLGKGDYWRVAETGSILRFVAEELGSGTYVNLTAQYRPAGRVGRDGRFAEIDRSVVFSECERALAVAKELGLSRLDSRGRAEGRALAA